MGKIIADSAKTGMSYPSWLASSRVGVFNHFGTVSAIIEVWFGAGCVSGVDDPLPK